MSELTKRRCPKEAQHTPGPKGYATWFDWAKKMSKTHRQTRCEGCGTYSVWVKK